MNLRHGRARITQMYLQVHRILTILELLRAQCQGSNFSQTISVYFQPHMYYNISTMNDLLKLQILKRHRIDERFIADILCIRLLAKPITYSIWSIGKGAERFIQELPHEYHESKAMSNYRVGKRFIQFIVPEVYLRHLYSDRYTTCVLPRTLQDSRENRDTINRRRILPTYNFDTDRDDFATRRSHSGLQTARLSGIRPSSSEESQSDTSALLEGWTASPGRQTHEASEQDRGLGAICTGAGRAELRPELSETVLSVLGLFRDTVVRLVVMTETNMQPLHRAEVAALRPLLMDRVTLTVWEDAL